MLFYDFHLSSRRSFSHQNSITVIKMIMNAKFEEILKEEDTI
jgi:hypothetical protein